MNRRSCVGAVTWRARAFPTPDPAKDWEVVAYAVTGSPSADTSMVPNLSP